MNDILQPVIITQILIFIFLVFYKGDFIKEIMISSRNENFNFQEVDMYILPPRTLGAVITLQV